jgi:hypothetical protein
MTAPAPPRPAATGATEAGPPRPGLPALAVASTTQQRYGPRPRRAVSLAPRPGRPAAPFKPHYKGSTGVCRGRQLPTYLQPRKRNRPPARHPGLGTTCPR